MALTLRNTKGAPLTYTELDDNFLYLEGISTTGSTSGDTFTTGVTTSGDWLIFDRNDTTNAYSVDLTPILTANTDYISDVFLTGSTLVFDNVGSAFHGVIDLSGITSSGDFLPLIITGDTTVSFGANVVTLAGSGDTIAWRYAGDYSAYYDDRSIVDKAYVDSVASSMTETAFSGNASNGNIVNIAGTNSTNNSVQDSLSMYFATITSAVTAGFAFGSPTSNRAYIGNFGSETGNINTAFAFGPSRNNSDGSGVNASLAMALSTQYWIKSGATASGIFAGRDSTIGYNALHSTIIGGSGHTVNNSVENSVILGGKSITATTSDTVYVPNLNVDGDAIGVPYDLVFAASDETTELKTGTSVTTLYAPRDFVVTKVKASLTTSGSDTTSVDVYVNDAALLSSSINLTSGKHIETTTSFEVNPPNIDEDDKITIDISSAGTDATGLKISIIGKIR
jgi:hypothetical protein